MGEAVALAVPVTKAVLDRVSDPDPVWVEV